MSLLAIIVTGLLSPASATLTLDLHSGGSDVLITDAGSGDTNPAAGQIGTNANVLSGWSGPVAASEDVSPYELGSSATSLKGPVGVTISIATTETFTVYGHPFAIYFLFDGYNSGSSSSMSDALYVNGVLAKRLGGTGAFSQTYASLPLTPGAYTIEDVVTLIQTGTNSQTYLSSTDLLIPEPMTVSLFGVGLFSIAVLQRRRHA